jgi:hypothetical protein
VTPRAFGASFNTATASMTAVSQSVAGAMGPALFSELTAACAIATISAADSSAATHAESAVCPDIWLRRICGDRRKQILSKRTIRIRKQRLVVTRRHVFRRRCKVLRQEAVNMPKTGTYT